MSSRPRLIEELDPAGLERELEPLTVILHACVEEGAGIGLLPPFELQDARRYWRRLAEPVAAGTVRLLVARIGGEVVGTAQLDLSGPAEARFRAELRMLLVHPWVRRRGLGTELVRGAEALALQLGRDLLLATGRRGESGQVLLRSCGWALTGIVPRHAVTAEGERVDAAFMHRELSAGGA